MKKHRKKKNNDKHSKADRDRKLQQGGQKKVKNKRYIPYNPKFSLLPLLFLLWELLSGDENDEDESDENE